ncbi:hypothetical protein L6R46_07650 [Myxococcota bacterium]|nr:hypothetical protein [Myxococcota bacterium]
MSALSTNRYGIAPGYGASKSANGQRRAASLAQTIPSAGPAGQHLRLVVLYNPAAEGAEDPFEAAPLTTPTDSLMWLGDLYSLVARQDPDSAIDLLIGHVDDLLSAGAFLRCDALLKTIDPERLDSNLVVATLLATRRAAPHLPERPAFIQRARARLLQLAPDRVERLLAGLD